MSEGSDTSSIQTSSLFCFRIVDLQVAVHRTRAEDQQRVTTTLDNFAEDTDLCEPFSRIRDALSEAQNTATKAA